MGFIINGKLGLTIDVKCLPLLEVTSSFHLRGEEKEKEELSALCLVEGADDTSDQSVKEGETLQDTAPVTESDPDF